MNTPSALLKLLRVSATWPRNRARSSTATNNSMLCHITGRTQTHTYLASFIRESGARRFPALGNLPSRKRTCRQSHRPARSPEITTSPTLSPSADLVDAGTAVAYIPTSKDETCLQDCQPRLDCSRNPCCSFLVASFLGCWLSYWAARAVSAVFELLSSGATEAGGARRAELNESKILAQELPADVSRAGRFGEQTE